MQEHSNLHDSCSSQKPIVRHGRMVPLRIVVTVLVCVVYASLWLYYYYHDKSVTKVFDNTLVVAPLTTDSALESQLLVVIRSFVVDRGASKKVVGHSSWLEIRTVDGRKTLGRIALAEVRPAKPGTTLTTDIAIEACGTLMDQPGGRIPANIKGVICDWLMQLNLTEFPNNTEMQKHKAQLSEAGTEVVTYDISGPWRVADEGNYSVLVLPLASLVAIVAIQVLWARSLWSQNR